MALLTREFLQDIGITLTELDYKMLAEHFDTTLYDRIINELVEELTPEQASELTHLQAADDETLRQWLVTNVPDLPEIVSDEIDILLGEIAEHSEAIGEL